MSYADLTYYKDTYFGYDPNDDTEIQRQLARATDDINVFCGQITDFTESDYTADEWLLLKKANSAQAEYLLKGGDDGTEKRLKRESTSNYSYEYAESGGAGGGICRRARKYLTISPFYDPNVNVRGNVCVRYHEFY